ncbi:MAG: trypsin-like peptidase domain-containing protein [Lachnospiraceae bacterium]|nr:trypsin-like peptidase domain-containing protein [Lachnospiraceae bacterium]
MKKLMKKINISLLALIIVLLSIQTNTVTMKAYDKEIFNGVAPIVWYGVNGEYIIADTYGNYEYISETDFKNYGLGDFVLDENGDQWISSGTCFFVGKTGEDPQYAVTNSHVVEDYMEQGGGQYFFNFGSIGNGISVGILYERTEMRILFDDNRDYEKVDVKWYGSSDEIDLALVKLKNPTDKRIALTLYDIPSDEDSKNSFKGDSVLVLGYPGISDNYYSTGSDKWDANAVRANEGIINNYSYTNKGVGWFEHSAETSHGNSGGPLILEENGYVIGVHSAGIQEDSIKQNFAIDVEYVIDMLDDNGVEYSLSSDSVSDSDENPTDSDSSAPASDSGSEGGSSEGGSTGIIIGLIAVAVVAVVIIIAIVTKKKKSQGTNAQSKDDEFKTEAAPVRPIVTPAPAQAAAPQRIAMARSLAPQHNGASFSLAHGAITVGRDASVCKIVYQAGTAGVSGKHCTIEYRPAQNVFIVTDLNSSYGTMLANGTKMEPNRHYSFNPGDSIFVGDKANEIRFEVH